MRVVVGSSAMRRALEIVHCTEGEGEGGIPGLARGSIAQPFFDKVEACVTLKENKKPMCDIYGRSEEKENDIRFLFSFQGLYRHTVILSVKRKETC